MIKKTGFILLITCLSFSCKKEKGNDPLAVISDVPEIGLSATSSTSITQFDDVIFSVNYTDGNGDLGETDADINSIFITDLRDPSIIHKFHLQPLSPVGEDITIQGILRVNLENIILLDQSNTTENASFQIYIMDRAGNKSNVITSPSIRITK